MTKNQFECLKPAKRRVKVAKDVIATLALPKRKRFKPTSGTYCTAKLPEDNFFEGKGYFQVQELLPKIQKHCEVCGIGALFISYIRLFNNLRLNQVMNASETYLSVHRVEITDTLRGTFPFAMLDEIESAFESREDWAERYPNETKRLRAICENIVANKGVFLIGEVPAEKGKKR